MVLPAELVDDAKLWYAHAIIDLAYTPYGYYREVVSALNVATNWTEIPITLIGSGSCAHVYMVYLRPAKNAAGFFCALRRERQAIRWPSWPASLPIYQLPGMCQPLLVRKDVNQQSVTSEYYPLLLPLSEAVETIKSGELEVTMDDIRSIKGQLLSTLATLVTYHVFYEDLKLANVAIDINGNCLLIDLNSLCMFDARAKDHGNIAGGIYDHIMTLSLSRDHHSSVTYRLKRMLFQLWHLLLSICQRLKLRQMAPHELLSPQTLAELMKVTDFFPDLISPAIDERGVPSALISPIVRDHCPLGIWHIVGRKLRQKSSISWTTLNETPTGELNSELPPANPYQRPPDSTFVSNPESDKEFSVFVKQIGCSQLFPANDWVALAMAQHFYLKLLLLPMEAPSLNAKIFMTVCDELIMKPCPRLRRELIGIVELIGRHCLFGKCSLVSEFPIKTRLVGQCHHRNRIVGYDKAVWSIKVVRDAMERWFCEVADSFEMAGTTSLLTAYFSEPPVSLR